MNANEIRSAVRFALENLEMIYQRLSSFVQKETDDKVKTSALTYECQGYYNAVEHIIIRMLKHLQVELPSGQFSHRDTLRTFEALLEERD